MGLCLGGIWVYGLGLQLGYWGSWGVEVAAATCADGLEAAIQGVAGHDSDRAARGGEALCLGSCFYLLHLNGYFGKCFELF